MKSKLLFDSVGRTEISDLSLNLLFPYITEGNVANKKKKM